ncbi:L,D-transpeptidase family protein [Streptomyces sp. PTM05]|uniref:L,D-transpeptidase family protein n=1 Tax=Streptantibioticus parmotrematis TaxID=2873249 RepID=A0ABS7QMB7_9ACTN|nr:L,D-transpeptidase family protein [Streptantibioticus parmotrematis]MBY8883906.1 L,D-transpeptidase family protein [Streptantibioticus parmotrematis]
MTRADRPERPERRTRRGRRAPRLWAALVASLLPLLTAGGRCPPPGPVDAGEVGGAGQVVAVAAHGSYATVTAWQRTGAGWHEVSATAGARVGANGVTDGATRVQGTDTTPTGVYRLTHAFGVGPDPGTALPYHQVTADDWWVEDPGSRYYNRMRRASQGGFPLTESGPHASEHLAGYPVQYHNAVVVDFNTDPAVPGRGAGIFLHDLGPQHGATAGCVAVPEPVLTGILRWLDPARRPVIAITGDAVAGGAR